jgi:hypothetical protein
VHRVAERFGFEPFGTVGLHAAAPRPIWEQMRDNIGAADCVIVAATPRYAQQDVHDMRQTGKGISEMLHTEVGMAVASNRPVLAFASPGTDLGHFLPQCTQYITLDPTDQSKLTEMWPTVANYFRSALVMIQRRWQDGRRSDAWQAVVSVLAVIGAATVISAVASSVSGEGDQEG